MSLAYAQRPPVVSSELLAQLMQRLRTQSGIKLDSTQAVIASKIGERMAALDLATSQDYLSIFDLGREISSYETEYISEKLSRKPFELADIAVQFDRIVDADAARAIAKTAGKIVHVMPGGLQMLQRSSGDVFAFANHRRQVISRGGHIVM